MSASFFLAGQTWRHEEFGEHEESLLARGHSVISSWLSQGAEMTFSLDDVVRADVLALFPEQPGEGNGDSGLQLALGIGLGLRSAGEPVIAPTIIAVGAAAVIFRAVPQIDAEFASWAEFLSALDGLPLLHIAESGFELRCPAHPLHRSTNWHRACWGNPFGER